MSRTPVVLAVDPGRDKCGVAVVAPDGAVAHHAVVPREDLAEAVASLERAYKPMALVIGDRTGSRACRDEIAVRAKTPVAFVPEHGTTIGARARYFRDNPPRGWMRLLPAGLRVPPGPIDDYAAILLAEAFWAGTERR